MTNIPQDWVVIKKVVYRMYSKYMVKVVMLFSYTLKIGPVAWIMESKNKKLQYDGSGLINTNCESLSWEKYTVIFDANIYRKNAKEKQQKWKGDVYQKNMKGSNESTNVSHKMLILKLF